MAAERTILEFIAGYSDADRPRVAFAPNGEEGADLVDSNMDFRWQVIGGCLESPDKATPQLLADLFLAEAALARAAWAAPRHFGDLGAALLIRGGATSLDAFAEGFNESFDTFGALQSLSLPPDLLAPLQAAAQQRVATEPDELRRA